MTQTNLKYYKVIAKCGHVGKNNYVPITFAVRAETASEASQKVLKFPRVKKHLKDAIISCEEINRKHYKEIIKVNSMNQYLKCKCNRQQACIENFESFVHKNVHHIKERKIEQEKNLKYRKYIYELGGFKHSLSNCFSED